MILQVIFRNDLDTLMTHPLLTFLRFHSLPVQLYVLVIYCYYVKFCDTLSEWCTTLNDTGVGLLCAVVIMSPLTKI